jgi:hypothetical protein
MRRVLPLLVALLCACEPESPLPEPRILSISPAEQTTRESKLVTVRLDRDPRFFVDYGAQFARLIDQPTLRIGSQTVNLERYLGHGQFEGTVGQGLTPGTYDVRVTLPDGRESTLAQAYRVKPYVTFWLETVGPQVEDQPFTLTIHAAGPHAADYTGTVLVTLHKGPNMAPTSFRSGAFSGGLLRQPITIDSPGSHYTFSVKDEENSTAYSNTFRVDPKN